MSNLLNSVQIVSEAIALPTIKVNHCFTSSNFFTGFNLLPSIRNWILFFIIPLFGVVQSKRIMESQSNKLPTIITNEDVFIYTGKDKFIETADNKGRRKIKVCCIMTQKLLEECLYIGLTEDELNIFVKSFNHHKYTDFNEHKAGSAYYMDKAINGIISNVKKIKRRKIQDLFIDKIIHDMEVFWGWKDNKALTRVVKKTTKRLKKSYKSYLKLIDEEESNEKSHSINLEFTLHRQCLAMYYLLQYSKVKLRIGVNDTDVARFIQLLTGRGEEGIKIQNTSIYKTWREIFNKEEKRNYQDLAFIKPYFEKLGLSEVVKSINNDMDINKEQKNM